MQYMVGQMLAIQAVFHEVMLYFPFHMTETQHGMQFIQLAVVYHFILYMLHIRQHCLIKSGLMQFLR